MFVLVKIQDTIKIDPSLFDYDHERALIEEIDRKYANKVVADVGLCITVYDLVSVGAALLHPSSGTSHTKVVFRMVSFRPFIGQVILGRIISCTRAHVRVSTEFSQDIIIPSHALQSPSHFDEQEKVWVWKYDEGAESFFMDINQEIRIRITQINYTRVLDSIKGIQATTTEKLPDKRRRSSSVDLSDSDPVPSALQLVGTINEDGLGLSSWWQ